MNGYFGIALLAADAWGFLSILLSPCHLSSIALVIGFARLKENPAQRRVFTLSLAFALGVFISILVVGAVTSLLGEILGYIGPNGNIISAAVLFLTGLCLLDWIKLSWTPVKLNPNSQRGWTGSAPPGIVFGNGPGHYTFVYMAPVGVAAFSLGKTSLLNAGEIVSMFDQGHCTVIVLSKQRETNREVTSEHWKSGNILSPVKKCSMLNKKTSNLQMR